MFIVNYPHIDYRDFVLWLQEEMKNKYLYEIIDYLKDYLQASGEWYEDAACLRVCYPSSFYNTANHRLAPYIKKFFKTCLNDTIYSWFYLDAD